MPISEATRTFLEEMRALGRDGQGREILVGLTFEETEWYFAYVDALCVSLKTREQTEKYLELHDKHEIVRLQVIGAEVEARDIELKN